MKIMRSGATYWCAIYPIDTVKSVMQTDENYLRQIQGSTSPTRAKIHYLSRVVRYGMIKL